MDLQARGLYREMLDLQWEDGSVPDDPEQVAQLIGASVEDVRSAWAVVRAAFRPGADGRLVNQRLERQRRETERYLAAKSRAGKAGAAARWGRWECACGRRFADRFAYSGHRRWCPSDVSETERQNMSVAPSDGGASLTASTTQPPTEDKVMRHDKRMRERMANRWPALELQDLDQDQILNPAFDLSTKNGSRPIPESKAGDAIASDHEQIDHRIPTIAHAFRQVFRAREAERHLHAVRRVPPTKRDRIAALASDLQTGQIAGEIAQRLFIEEINRL